MLRLAFNYNLIDVDYFTEGRLLFLSDVVGFSFSWHASRDTLIHKFGLEYMNGDEHGMLGEIAMMKRSKIMVKWQDIDQDFILGCAPVTPP